MIATIQVILVIAIIPTNIWLFTHIFESIKKYPSEERFNQFFTLLFYKGLIVFIGFGIAFGVSETSLHLASPLIALGSVLYAHNLN
jgi:hypothetical protein